MALTGSDLIARLGFASIAPSPEQLAELDRAVKVATEWVTRLVRPSELASEICKEATLQKAAKVYRLSTDTPLGPFDLGTTSTGAQFIRDDRMILETLAPIMKPAIAIGPRYAAS